MKPNDQKASYGARVSDMMTKDVIVGKPNMEIYEATMIMIKHNVKKLPIVEKNHLARACT
jgi:predicted transcriptional regulator